MHDLVITGASRGIGRALVQAIIAPDAPAARVASRPARLFLIARDETRLAALAETCVARGIETQVLAADLSDLSRARGLGKRLAGLVRPGAVLVHNAGIWPAARERDEAGFERAFVVNHAAPFALQAPLLEQRKLARLLVVSAGLLVKGHVDALRTPEGLDFSALRTYATTKLCFALATRDVAAVFPEVDFAVIHPGVVETDLGARPNVLGWLLQRVKRRWERPEICGARLADVLALARWSTPGEAAWFFEAEPRPWPEIADDARERAAVRAIVARLATPLTGKGSLHLPLKQYSEQQSVSRSQFSPTCARSHVGGGGSTGPSPMQ